MGLYLLAAMIASGECGVCLVEGEMGVEILGMLPD